MITYFYWFVVVALILSALYMLGWKFEKWKPALITAALIIVVGLGAYYFYFEQIFVKRYGGIMSISVPAGQLHITATWKDDNLWIENYDPKSNTCHFNEYSKGNLLQGKVTIKNCNPLLRTKPATQSSSTPSNSSSRPSETPAGKQSE